MGPCDLFVFVVGSVLAASIVTALESQAPVNVWKTSNSSRPWQNPSWSSSSSQPGVNSDSQKTATQNQNSEWPSLSNSRQVTQQPQLPSQRTSYSGAVGPSSQGTQSSATGLSSQQTLNRGHSQVQGSVNHRRPTPATSTSLNRTRSTDQELTTLSEKLFDHDASDAGKNVMINYQSRTQSNSLTDEAPKPLLSVDKDVQLNPTIKALYQLYDNYIADSSFVESETAQEHQEESEFLDRVLETRVMREAMEFLAEKGYVDKSNKAYKDLLNSIWFTMYSRGGGIIGSSAFEHVFLGELKRDEVSGLHSWLYFAREEENLRVDYMGYLKKLDLGKKSNLLKVHYRWVNVIKPSGSMFVGTSPELEMALYTVCFLTRPNDRCPLSLGGKTFGIQTYTYRLNRNRGTVIGSAYPVF